MLAEFHDTFTGINAESASLIRSKVFGRGTTEMLEILTLESRYPSQRKMVETSQLAEKVVNGWNGDVLAVREMDPLQRGALS